MHRQKHLVLIIHGARADLPELRHLVSWVRAKGHRVETRVTWESDDATTFARAASERGADVVIAAGGDGTVNEVVNGLGGTDTPLGIIPVGTANDFARQIGVPMDPDHAMDVILRRKPRRVDTISLNGRRFLNASVGGLGAEATAETPAQAKEQFGAFAYALTGVRKLADLEPGRAWFRGPGLALDLEFLVFVVGNARASGGGTQVTPRARLDDGLLDLCIVEARKRSEFARLALRMKRGEHLGVDGVHYFQLAEVDIVSEVPLAVNIDGEPRVERRLEYRVLPNDLLVHAVCFPGEPDTLEDG
jgi:diacylglycerol kinase (ATP)